MCPFDDVIMISSEYIAIAVPAYDVVYDNCSLCSKRRVTDDLDNQF